MPSVAQDGRPSTAADVARPIRSRNLRLVRTAPLFLLALLSLSVCLLVACGRSEDDDVGSADDELCASYGYSTGKCHGYGYAGYK